MKKDFFNRTHVEGILYNHTLELKVTGPNSKAPGTNFIAGNVEIATDNDCLNIVPVHFSYVTATTAKGTPNATYNTLMDIISGKLGAHMDGSANPAMLRIDSAIGLNEFYTDRNGTTELVSAKRNEGGFVHVTNTLDPDEKLRGTFDCDMIITSVTHKDADEERSLPEKAILKGWIFDFRKSLLPVEFSAINPLAISYFEGLEATSSNPAFTHIRGRQISETVVKSITEESAFGESHVREVKNTRKDFVVTWAAPDVYEWDDPSTLTVAELKEMIANRETYLATLRARQDEYNASKNKPAAAAAIDAKDFNF